MGPPVDTPQREHGETARAREAEQPAAARVRAEAAEAAVKETEQQAPPAAEEAEAFAEDVQIYWEVEKDTPADEPVTLGELRGLFQGNSLICSHAPR